VSEMRVDLLEAQAAEVAVAIAQTKRSCGQCSLCCKLLDVPALEKPKDVWCKHCKPGKGCSIYADRPLMCRAWACGWLTGGDFGEHWYPARAKMVINKVVINGRCDVIVDPGYPNRWREEPWHSDIRKIARNGLEGAFGEGRWQTRVCVGNRTWLILPNKDVECDGQHDLIMPLGVDDFAFVQFGSDEAALRGGERLKKFHEAVQTLTANERLSLFEYIYAKAKAAGAENIADLDAIRQHLIEEAIENQGA
jgi:hypothetical protein